MKKSIFLLACVCHTWVLAQPVPPPRYSFALAFDNGRGKLVMFGGFSQGKMLNDTWEWDGVSWELKSQEGPSPRNSPAMTYDSKRKILILFGGSGNGKSFGDTWEWNGTAWKLLSAEGPPGRSIHTLEYDAHRDKVVLFGGINGQKIMNDIWEWNGTSWTQMSTPGGPDARFLHASAYDEQYKQTLIFGGNTVAGPSTQESIRGDFWAWNGSSWEQLNNQGPSPRDHVDMAYDPLKKKVIVHGGGTPGGGSAGDTWEWDGKTWSVLSTNSVAPQEGYKMAFDPKSKSTLLFGGFVGGSPASSLWKLSGNKWSLIK